MNTQRFVEFPKPVNAADRSGMLERQLRERQILEGDGHYTIL